MSACGCDSNLQFDGVSKSYIKILWLIIGINAVMFFVETGASMGSIALLAFFANAGSTLLLLKYRNGDSNVRSVWLCSRNDSIGNLAVMLAAAVVYQTQSHWPDLIVAFLMALLFLHSAFLILRQAISELNTEQAINV